MVKTPSVPFTEQVMSQVVVVTSKKKMRSNTLPFMFIPSVSSSVCLNKSTANELLSFTVEDKVPSSSLTICNSPQAATSSSHSSSSDLTDVFTSFPSSPANNDLSSILDICVQSLDMEAEKKILPTAILPANSLPVQGSLQLFDLDHAV